MHDIEQAVRQAIQKVFTLDVQVDVTRTQEQFGDFTTNVAMQIAPQLGKPPRDIAETIASTLRGTLADRFATITVAGPGFINLTLTDSALMAAASQAPTTKPATFAGKVVITEYSDPNPFKVLHAGHLYTSIVGDAISNSIAAAGGVVHRVNFGGDVGLHVGKTLWAILQDLSGEHPEKLQDIPDGEHAEWLARCYVAGTNAYEDDEAAKAAIIDLNKRVYQIVADADHESPFAHIYWTCRQWSYDYFDEFYARIGTHFEKYYPESTVAALGLATVKKQLQAGVYSESNGAVVFVGEPYGLHTRVFITAQGLPTYEAKDVGLLMQKWQDYHFDQSVIITGNDIIEYMKVVLKSVEQFEPSLAAHTTHVTHGNVKLQGGVKMSSRKGNFLRAADVLDAAHAANLQATGRDDDQVVLGAIKYSFLKQRIGADLIYDPAESVSLEGNSGPYLQYAHARARSILRKVDVAGGSNDAPAATDVDIEHQTLDLDTAERSLARAISEYPEVLSRSVAEMLPHHICTYLYELAQAFNRFYEHATVIGGPRQTTRVALVQLYADVLQDGLTLLGIATPDQL